MFRIYIFYISYIFVYQKNTFYDFRFLFFSVLACYRWIPSIPKAIFRVDPFLPPSANTHTHTHSQFISLVGSLPHASHISSTMAFNSSWNRDRVVPQRQKFAKVFPNRLLLLFVVIRIFIHVVVKCVWHVWKNGKQYMSLMPFSTLSVNHMCHCH